MRSDFRRMSKWFIVATLAALLAGCGGGSQHAAQTITQSGPATNPIDFPLASDSRVLVAKAFKQDIHTTNSSNDTVMKEGNGMYVGNEVIAGSPASFDALQAWLKAQYAKPPAGYRQSSDVHASQQDETARSFGVDGRDFETTQSGKKVSLIVVVMDPAKVTGRLGPVLTLIRRYRDMPEFMRSPIDKQVKDQTGYSVSDMLQPDSPLGLALDALGEFSHTNERAILMLNAHKQ